MKKTIFSIVLCIASNVTMASEGYFIVKDFNGDNIQDLITSGPIELFDSFGGPFLIRISNIDGTYEQTVADLGSDRVMIENSTPPVLWSLRREEANKISRYSIQLDSSFSQENKAKNVVGSIDAASFEKLYSYPDLIKFIKVSNYSPPPHPTSEWGK